MRSNSTFSKRKTRNDDPIDGVRDRRDRGTGPMRARLCAGPRPATAPGLRDRAVPPVLSAGPARNTWNPRRCWVCPVVPRVPPPTWQSRLPGQGGNAPAPLDCAGRDFVDIGADYGLMTHLTTHGDHTSDTHQTHSQHTVNTRGPHRMTHGLTREFRECTVTMEPFWRKEMQR